MRRGTRQPLKEHSGKPDEPMLSQSPQISRRPKHQDQNNRPNNTPSNPCYVWVSCLPFENSLMNDHRECSVRHGCSDEIYAPVSRIARTSGLRLILLQIGVRNTTP